MSIAKKGDKNTYLRLSTGGENITFSPTISEDFFSLSLKNKIAIELINNYENFNGLDESHFIDYNVIHMKNTQKQKNIDKQMIKLGKKINIFNAVIGKNVKKLDEYDKNLKLNLLWL